MLIFSNTSWVDAIDTAAISGDKKQRNDKKLGENSEEETTDEQKKRQTRNRRPAALRLSWTATLKLFCNFFTNKC